jgi:hypothetical protein
MPEHASMFFDPIAAGAERAGRMLADLDLQIAKGVVTFSDDVESLIAPRKLRERKNDSGQSCFLHVFNRGKSLSDSKLLSSGPGFSRCDCWVATIYAPQALALDMGKGASSLPLFSPATGRDR